MTGAKFGDLALVEYGAVAGAGVEVKPGVIDPVPLGKGGWIAERLGPGEDQAFVTASHQG